MKPGPWLFSVVYGAGLILIHKMELVSDSYHPFVLWLVVSFAYYRGIKEGKQA